MFPINSIFYPFILNSLKNHNFKILAADGYTINTPEVMVREDIVVSNFTGEILAEDEKTMGVVDLFESEVIYDIIAEHLEEMKNFGLA